MLPMGVLSGLLLYESPTEEAGEGRESEKNNLHFLIMCISFMPLLALLYLLSNSLISGFLQKEHNSFLNLQLEDSSCPFTEL